jgi:hypothetical protein
MSVFAIVGSRHFRDYELFCKICDPFQSQMSQIVSGGALGADTLAERYAKEHHIELLIIPAQWHIYGKAAGPRRNRLIVDRANHMVAFLGPNSKGTADSIRRALFKGIPVKVVKVEK